MIRYYIPYMKFPFLANQQMGLIRISTKTDIKLLSYFSTSNCYNYICKYTMFTLIIHVGKDINQRSTQ